MKQRGGGMEVSLECILPSTKVLCHSLLNNCHADWKEILIQALSTMNQDYISQFIKEQNWLPGNEQLFAAFSLPLAKTQYILLGESPYPRKDSANGYAFWDNAVNNLWCDSGLSKEVNRATSLRNLIKMLLVARGDLTSNLSQVNIALINKECLVQTAQQLFQGMMNKGILLLNTTLIYSEGKVSYHARQWKPFMQSLFEQLRVIKPSIKLILLGKFAETLPQNKLPIGLIAEHPYNISFISNQDVLNFFKPLDLLKNE